MHIYIHKHININQSLDAKDASAQFVLNSILQHMRKVSEPQQAAPLWHFAGASKCGVLGQAGPSRQRSLHRHDSTSELEDTGQSLLSASPSILNITACLNKSAGLLLVTTAAPPFNQNIPPT